MLYLCNLTTKIGVNMKKLAILLIVIGCILFGLGMSMRTKQHAITRLQTEIQKGNRGTAIAVGAGTGAIVGGAAGATIGGIGIAICGTGVGIPAGVVCLLAAGVCSLIGGGAGAAVSTPDKTISKPVTEMINAYSPMEYWSVLIIGAVLIGVGIYIFMWVQKNKTSDNICNQ